MAVWQFTIYLIKKSKVGDYDVAMPFEKNENALNWEREKVSKDSIKAIAKVLPPEKSWSKNIEQYGKIDETCLQFSFDSRRLCSMYFRLDLRSLTKDIIDEILKFMQVNDAYFVQVSDCKRFDPKDGSVIELGDNNCYPAEEKALIELLRNSNAYKFCKDPNGYLGSLDIN